MIEGMSKVREISGDVLVTAIYQGPKKPDTEEGTDDYLVDVNGLLPGQVKVNMDCESDDTANDKSARVMVPYGHHPPTTTGESGNLEEFSLNQSFGFFAMPRVGDKVFVIGMASNDLELAASIYYVFGSPFLSGKHRPPLTDAEDVQTLHRSGASIRLNDTFGGGGSIGTDGSDILDNEHMEGLTGNVTITGNRTMILSGSKYLAHGLLSKYGDPREPFIDAKIDTFSKMDTYENLFSNQEETYKYHDPFASTLIGSDGYFLSPPSTITDESVIPLTNNTLLMLQHGGGVMRIDDHDVETGYSRITMSAASITTLVGMDYQQVGLEGISTSPDGHDDASGIDEEGNEYAIHQIRGAKFKIYVNGDVDVFAAPGGNVTIKSVDGEGEVHIGEGVKAVFRDGDETTTNRATPAVEHQGLFGVPHAHVHNGHSHEGVERQSETYA